jgi:hypothetical protein
LFRNAFLLSVALAVVLAASAVSAYDTEQLGFDKILYVKRPPYHGGHYYEFFMTGVVPEVHYRGDNNIYIYDLDAGHETPLIDKSQLPTTTGLIGRFDLSYDAQKLVFDYKPENGEGFRIWEVNIDGSGLHQLTFEPENEKTERHKYWEPHRSENFFWHTDDMHPCYLPDGGIVFASTRNKVDVPCVEGMWVTAQLYRMDADGSNMCALSHGAAHEFTPAVDNQGRIIYNRWEYVDKPLSWIKCLCAMNPDGTRSIEIFGNDHNYPPTIWQARPVPRRDDLLVATVTHHSPLNGSGGVWLVQTNRDIRAYADIPRDQVANNEVQPVIDLTNNANWRSRRTFSSFYRDPYPVSERLFLVSHNTNGDCYEYNGFDLYLMDDKGGKELIAGSQDTSLFLPYPLKQRKMPAVLPTTADPTYAAQNKALCIVTNVHHGMEGVPEGTIKWIRINAQLPRPWGTLAFNDCRQEGAMQQGIGPYHTGGREGQGGHLLCKVQIGIVPVEKDGSAHFTVPANMNIFFQALDEDYKEVQRERTFINYMPGEVRSCIGCHERISDAPAPNNVATPIALTRPPSEPGPQPGEVAGRRVLDFRDDIQPILDTRCISCHDDSQPPDLRGIGTRWTWKSYDDLVRRIGRRVDEFGSDVRGGYYFPPYTLGSHTSPLIEMLERGHQGVELSRGELVRFITWVDSNGQSFGAYWGRKNSSEEGHPNYRPSYTWDMAVAKHPYWIPWQDR